MSAASVLLLPPPIKQFRKYKNMKCDICFINSLVKKNYAGFNFICYSCLQMEEKERADQLAFAKEYTDEINAFCADAICADAICVYAVLQINIDFDTASLMWRANKKKVKNGNGSFVYV
jgi:hypothetical protein